MLAAGRETWNRPFPTNLRKAGPCQQHLDFGLLTSRPCGNTFPLFKAFQQMAVWQPLETSPSYEISYPTPKNAINSLQPPPSTLKSSLSLGMQPVPPPWFPSLTTLLLSAALFAFCGPLESRLCCPEAGEEGHCCFQWSLPLVVVPWFSGWGGTTLPQFPTPEVCVEPMTHDPRLLSQRIDSSGHYDSLRDGHLTQ